MVISSSVFSQRLTYAYDSAGNRLSRTNVLTASSDSFKSGPQLALSEKIFMKDSVLQEELKIHFAGGVMEIHISDRLASGNGSMEIFPVANDNASAVPFINKESLSSEQSLSMTSLNPGSYTMRFSFGEETSTWTIIIS